MSINRARTLLPYLLTGALSFIAFFFAIHLWQADLNVPFGYASYGDDIEIKLQQLLYGGFFHDVRLAAPFGQDTQSVPQLYTLQWAIRSVLIEITRNPFLTQNLFDILSPILNAVAFLYAGRRLGLSYQSAIPCAILYGNLYTVYWRISAGHPFQAAYWVTPLVCVALIQICDGTRLITARDRAIFLGTAFLLGLESHYEAFFGCFLVVAAIVIGSIQLRAAEPLRLGRAFIVATAVGFVVNDSPSLIWILTHRGQGFAYGRNPIEAYLYALSIAQMISPIPGHRVPLLAAMRQHLDMIYPPLTTENAAATLGLVATAGFFLLFAVLVAGGRYKVPRILEFGALLNLAAIALATIGGLGVLFSRFISPDIRSYSRISPFIAFFCLLAIAYVLDRLWMFLSTRRRIALYTTVAALVVVVGVFDQSPANAPPYAKSRERVAIDRAWTARIVATVPANSAILEIPFVPFPELPITESLQAQLEQVPYLYARNLRWSVGAVDGSPDARFERWFANLPPKDMVAVALLSGFDGALVYREGFADRGRSIENTLQALSKQPALINDDATQAFYPLDTLAKRAHAADADAGTPQGITDAVALFKSSALPESNPHVSRIESAIAKPS